MPSAEQSAGPAELEFHRQHLLGRTGWLEALAGVFAVVIGWFVLSILVVGLLDGVGIDVTVDPLTPGALLATDLVWAFAILLVAAVTLLVHQLPFGRVVSVVGRIRWRWLLICLGLAVITLALAVGVSMFFPQQPGTELSDHLNAFTDRMRDFTLIVVLLTPLQAAGEEFVFRGYLTQAFGGLARGRVGAALAVVVPALLFALAHGAQSLPVFVDRFAFGLIAGVLVLVTGGLEAGIAMHLLNNWLSLGLALAVGDINAAINPEGGTWGTLPSTLTQSLVYLALVLWIARRTGLETRSEGGVLAGNSGHR
ncbi:type II CAAX endopeptidase family protein [Nocardioides panacisoli]|uniref:CPBP family intramembrane metalloprotease n=1 Tax=Nocardioides panacisoli TaxID=627624 RepID=A0ABP7I1H1_9ACTN